MKKFFYLAVFVIGLALFLSVKPLYIWFTFKPVPDQVVQVKLPKKYEVINSEVYRVLKDTIILKEATDEDFNAMLKSEYPIGIYYYQSSSGLPPLLKVYYFWRNNEINFLGQQQYLFKIIVYNSSKPITPDIITLITSVSDIDTATGKIVFNFQPSNIPGIFFAVISLLGIMLIFISFFGFRNAVNAENTEN